MKTSTKIIIFLAAIIAAFSIVIDSYIEEYKFQKSEAERQKSNVEVLNKNFKSYKNAQGQAVAKVEALEYTVKELKANEAKLYKKLLTNNVKTKNVKSVTQIGTSSHLEIKTHIEYVDTNKCFTYENEFYTVNGCFDSDSATVIVETRDSLTIAPVIIPKRKFLWWSWGVKAIELTVISDNPFSNINYLRYIEISK